MSKTLDLGMNPENYYCFDSTFQNVLESNQAIGHANYTHEVKNIINLLQIKTTLTYSATHSCLTAKQHRSTTTMNFNSNGQGLQMQTENVSSLQPYSIRVFKNKYVVL
jgi:hypothetical protein